MYDISSLEPGECFYYVFEYYYFQHLRVLKKRAEMMREEAKEIYERNLKTRKEELSDIDYLFDELIKEAGASTELYQVWCSVPAQNRGRSGYRWVRKRI